MTADVKTIHRTYQTRGYCARSGYARIKEVLRACRWLYNRSLEQRRNIYRACGKSMSKFAQMKHLTRLRAEQQAWRDLSLQVSRGVLVRLDRAFRAFFRRVKAGQKPGFPRFQGMGRYQCIELAEVTPGMVKGNRINIKGLPAIRIRPSAPLPDSKQLKALRLVMHGRTLSVDLKIFWRKCVQCQRQYKKSSNWSILSRSCRYHITTKLSASTWASTNA